MAKIGVFCKSAKSLSPYLCKKCTIVKGLKGFLKKKKFINMRKIGGGGWLDKKFPLGGGGGTTIFRWKLAKGNPGWGYDLSSRTGYVAALKR